MQIPVLENLIKHYKIDKKVLIADKIIEIPVKYSNVEALMAFFPISIVEAKKLLRTKRLKPISILNKKCLLGITIFDYVESPVGPYRELALSIPIMFDSKISIPILPLIVDSLFKQFGFYTIILAMDSNIAREHSEKIFDYPTYTKNIEIDIKKNEDDISVISKERNETIIHLKMDINKKFKIAAKNFDTYFIKDNKIMKVVMNTAAFMSESMKKEDLILNLGNHEISRIIKGLKIQSHPIRVVYYRKAIEILNPPKCMGEL